MYGIIIMNIVVITLAMHSRKRDYKAFNKLFKLIKVLKSLRRKSHKMHFCILCIKMHFYAKMHNKFI